MKGNVKVPAQLRITTSHGLHGLVDLAHNNCVVRVNDGGGIMFFGGMVLNGNVNFLGSIFRCPTIGQGSLTSYKSCNTHRFVYKFT